LQQHDEQQDQANQDVERRQDVVEDHKSIFVKR
jgi:hypothetical protein